MLSTNAIEIYTDGSGTTSDKPCGWAFVLTRDGEVIHEQSGALTNGTNNVAELMAAVKGLAYAYLYHRSEQITLVSDSKLVLGYADGSYKIKTMHLAALYIALRRLYIGLGASGKWVKGHSGDVFNERCDVLAKAARTSYETG